MYKYYAFDCFDYEYDFIGASDTIPGVLKIISNWIRATDGDCSCVIAYPADKIELRPTFEHDGKRFVVMRAFF